MNEVEFSRNESTLNFVGNFYFLFFILRKKPHTRAPSSTMDEVTWMSRIPSRADPVLTNVQGQRVGL